MEFERVREIVAEQLSVDIETITEATEFEKDLKADSLDLFQVIMALEDAYSLEFSVEMTKSIKSVGDAARYIEENMI